MTKTITEHFCDHCGAKVPEGHTVYFETWSGMDGAGSRDHDGPTLHLCPTAMRELLRLMLQTSRTTSAPAGIPRPFTDEERAALAKWIARKSPHPVDLRYCDAP